MYPAVKAAVLAGALLAPGVASAQLTLGARAGVALPFGELEEGAPAKDVFARTYPIEATVGWRLTPALEAGVQATWAPASEGEAWTLACAMTGRDCGAHLWRLAARGEYAGRAAELRPFAAVTLGWEWEVERWELQSDSWGRTARNGWLAGLEAGADLPLARKVDLGAFIGLSFGQYRWWSERGELAGYPLDDAGTVGGASIHGWVSIGLRGRLSL